MNPRKRREIGELRVSFIHHHDRARCGLQNAPQLFFAYQRASWIVRVRNKQNTRILAQLRKNIIDWKFHVRAAANRTNSGSGNLCPIAVHGKRRLADQDTGVRLDEGIEENAQRVVAAIGEQQLLRADPEMTRQPICRLLILGIHGQLFGREPGQGTPNRGRAPGSVFIEVEAHFAGAPFSGSLVRAAIQNCLAHGQLYFHRRTPTALRWAIRPSDSARVSTVSARQRNPLLVIVCTLMHFTKSAVESPPRRRAQPPVGKT